MTRIRELDIWEEKRQILRNPTPENAMKLWDYALLGKPLSDTVAMAGLHKARVLWRGSSKKMVKESKQWLRDHGYLIPTRGGN